MSKEHIQNKVVDIANESLDRLASGAHEAVDRVAGAATQAADSIDQKGEQIKELQQEWLAGGRAYVQEHPIKALGIAVVGGFLLSRLLSSR